MSIEPDEVTTGEQDEDSLEELQGRPLGTGSPSVDVDDSDLSDHELPGADLSGETLIVRVVPQMADEFTCQRCFLVVHRSQMVDAAADSPWCNDCD